MMVHRVGVFPSFASLEVPGDQVFEGRVSEETAQAELTAETNGGSVANQAYRTPWRQADEEGHWGP